jgi:hypothetical protein
MNASMLISLGLGAAVGYYFVKHYLKTGKPA